MLSKLGARWLFVGSAMDVEDFVTTSFRDRLGADLIAVSAKSMPGTKFVRVTVRGRLQEAEALAADMMAEFAELDRALHIAVEAGSE
jgi:hypothetical protein